MCSAPEVIYLIPGEDVDGAPAMVWCDDPAPSYACDPTEAVKYVRADIAVQQLEQAQARVVDLVAYAECNDPENPHIERAKAFLAQFEKRRV